MAAFKPSTPFDVCAWTTQSERMLNQPREIQTSTIVPELFLFLAISRGLRPHLMRRLQPSLALLYHRRGRFAGRALTVCCGLFLVFITRET